MILTDLHVHSVFCDGKNTPEEMVLTAIDKGLKTIGVLAHSFVENDPEGTLSPEKTQEFISCVTALKDKYKDKINVLLGIEADYFSNIDLTPYDYVIGSVHYFSANGKIYLLDYSKDIFVDVVNKVFDGDYYSAAENYYDNVSNEVEKTGADIIAHIDLITKFNENDNLFSTDNPRYINAYKKAIDKLVTYNKPFEINTGVIGRGHRSSPYPAKPVYDYIKSQGGKFILSSDAHSKEGIAFEFSKWAKEFDLL